MDIADALPPTALRVERHTSPRLNERLRSRANERIAQIVRGDDHGIEGRLRELDAEWDIERRLQLNASALVTLGTALGIGVDRRFLLLPALVLFFLGQHALQGWCPPVPLFRRMGTRTQGEIERERMALKALRGDFERLESRGPEPGQRARAALAAVDA